MICIWEKNTRKTSININELQDRQTGETELLQGESIPAILRYSFSTQLSHLQGKATSLPLRSVENRQFCEKDIRLILYLDGQVIHTFLLSFLLFFFL